MITIGIGNIRGGVSSTTLTFQIAALLERAGLRVTIVETSRTGTDHHWCVGRAARRHQIPNVSRNAISHLYLNDLSCRLRDYELGSDFALLDYSNERQDIVSAMSHVQHWICPFRPLEVEPTVQTYECWRVLQPNALVGQETFSAVLALAPGPHEIEMDPAYAEPRWDGTETVETLASHWPGMHILQQRLTQSEAGADTFDGRDVFSSPAPGALAASEEIESVWGEILQHLKRGGVASASIFSCQSRGAGRPFQQLVRDAPQSSVR